MLPDNYWTNKTYVFYIQNPEDFYSQLEEFNKRVEEADQEIDVEDVTTAKKMLQSIGIKTE